jgi:DNA-directed RNA polymerase specialized sigma24 family protein
LNEAQSATADVPVDALDALASDRALQKLEQLNPDQGRIVELRFFGGLTIEETAAALGISPATVKREWALAKGWLYRELNEGGGQYPAALPAADRPSDPPWSHPPSLTMAATCARTTPGA